MVDHFDLTCGFGAKRLNDGSVRFRLWAPAQETVSVAIESGDLLPMRRSADGWFEANASGAGWHALSLSPVGWSDGALIRPPPGRHRMFTTRAWLETAHSQWKHPEWRGRPWTETVLYEVHAGTAGGFRGHTGRPSPIEGTRA